MTNSIAISIVVVFGALLAFDFLQYDWANMLFLARKFMALIEWMAFWR